MKKTLLALAFASPALAQQAIHGTPENCRFPGGTFGGVSCLSITYMDHHWGGPGSVNTTGAVINVDQTGGGVSGAMEQGTGAVALNITSLYSRPGIANDFSLFSQKHSVGDFIPYNGNHWARAGCSELSDQCVNLFQEVGGEPTGAPTFTLAGAQPHTKHPAWNFGVTNCGGGPWCLGSAGGYAQSRDELLASVHFADRANVWTPLITYPAGAAVSYGGKFYASMAPNTAVTPGTDETIWSDKTYYAWMNVSAVAETNVPLTTGTCASLGLDIDPNTGSDNPKSVTFTCQAQSGTFAVGDLVAVAGGPGVNTVGNPRSGHYETSTITAVTGTMPQTITLGLAFPHFNIALFKGGLAGSTGCEAAYEAMTAETSGNGNINCPPWPVLGSMDGHSVIYYMPLYGGGSLTGLPVLGVGTDPSTYGGINDPRAVFNIYCSAKVAAFLTNEASADITLEDNNCAFPANGSVMLQDFPAQQIIGHWEGVRMMNQAMPGATNLGGHNESIGGAAAGGNAYFFNMEMGSSHCFLFTHLCDGMEPPSMLVSGAFNKMNSYWGSLLSSFYSPRHSILSIGQMAPGQTQVDIATMPHGSLTYNDVSGGFEFTREFRSTALAIRRPNQPDAHFGVYNAWPFNSMAVGQTLTGSQFVDVLQPFTASALTATGNVSGRTVIGNTVKGNFYQGLKVAPVGKCPEVAYSLNMDGTISFCKAIGAQWVTKPLF